MATTTPEIHVLVGGENRLLCELLSSFLAGDTEFDVERDVGLAPDGLRRILRGIPSARTVILLADPISEEWSEAVDALRADHDRAGVVVITARPSYGEQRRWLHELNPGLTRANALLSLASDPGDVEDALREAWKRPHQRSQFWLDGPRHPFALGRTESGRRAAELRANPVLHETLVLAAQGVPHRVLAERVGRVHVDQIRDRLTRIQKILQVRSDVELGFRAAQLGLLDDLEGLGLDD